jgi:hypothetical protein
MACKHGAFAIRLIVHRRCTEHIPVHNAQGDQAARRRAAMNTHSTSKHTHQEHDMHGCQSAAVSVFSSTVSCARTLKLLLLLCCCCCYAAEGEDDEDRGQGSHGKGWDLECARRHTNGLLIITSQLSKFELSIYQFLRYLWQIP